MSNYIFNFCMIIPTHAIAIIEINGQGKVCSEQHGSFTASLLEVRHLLEQRIQILCKQQVNFIDETNLRLYQSFRFNDQF